MSAGPMPPGQAAQSGALSRSAWTWAAFEGFRTPSAVLITIAVFMPYYVSVVAASPVEGQALVARAGQIAGWTVALTAPLMGLVADRYGPRKPLLTFAVLGMIPIFASLWFVVPGGPIFPALFIAMLALKSIFFAWSEVLHNSMLVTASRGQTARTSGLGLAMGNGVSVLLMITILWAFALPGQVDWAFVPDKPLLGVDTAAHEQARMTGPLVASLMGIGLLLFLWGVPDVPRTGEKLSTSIRKSVGDLKQMFKALGEEREAAKFLLARMIYVDGKTAILMFSGVLAAGVMGWGTMQMLAFGLFASAMSVVGGLLGGWLDTKIGSKNAIIVEILWTAAVLSLQLGTTPTTIAFMPVSTAPLHDGPMFQTLPELVFLVMAGLAGVSITAAYASSRTLLTKLVSPQRAASFFGLYALSGTITAWLGPMLVAIGTVAMGSQQGGLSWMLGLLGLGLLLLLRVKSPD